MLARSPEPGAEEFATHDHEGWGGLQLGEHESIEALAALAAAMETHGPVVAALVAYLGGLQRLAEAERMMSDCYLGSWSSFRAGPFLLRLRPLGP